MVIQLLGVKSRQRSLFCNIRDLLLRWLQVRFLKRLWFDEATWKSERVYSRAPGCLLQMSSEIYTSDFSSTLGSIWPLPPTSLLLNLKVPAWSHLARSLPLVGKNNKIYKEECMLSGPSFQTMQEQCSGSWKSRRTTQRLACLYIIGIISVWLPLQTASI